MGKNKYIKRETSSGSTEKGTEYQKTKISSNVIWAFVTLGIVAVTLAISVPLILKNTIVNYPDELTLVTTEETIEMLEAEEDFALMIGSPDCSACSEQIWGDTEWKTKPNGQFGLYVEDSEIDWYMMSYPIEEVFDELFALYVYIDDNNLDDGFMYIRPEAPYDNQNLSYFWVWNEGEDPTYDEINDESQEIDGDVYSLINQQAIGGEYNLWIDGITVTDTQDENYIATDKNTSYYYDSSNEEWIDSSTTNGNRYQVLFEYTNSSGESSYGTKDDDNDLTVDTVTVNGVDYNQFYQSSQDKGYSNQSVDDMKYYTNDKIIASQIGMSIPMYMYFGTDDNGDYGLLMMTSSGLYGEDGSNYTAQATTDATNVGYQAFMEIEEFYLDALCDTDPCQP